MQNLIIVGVLAFCAGAALANSPQQSNLYIDSIINSHLRNEIRARQLDPIRLSTFSTDFKEKISLVTVNVKTEYSQGNMTGLSGIYRLNNCGAPFWTNNMQNSTLNCTLALDNLQINYQGKAKFGVVPAINIKAKANLTRTAIRVTVTANRYRNLPKLTKFELISVGVIRSSFTGVGPLNSALKALSDTFAAQLSTQVYYTLNYNLKAAIEAVVGRLTMPMPR